MCLLVITEFGFFEEELLSGQCFDRILVVRQVEVGIPCEVAFLYVDGTDGQVDADVLRLSDIANHIAVS